MSGRRAPAGAPLVSVVLTTYNRRDLLARAVRSVLAQTLADFELIVVNDAGEAVDDVLAGFADDRIAHERHPVNRGQGAARNTALGRARGAYVAYLDDDDQYHPDHLEALAAALDAGRADLVYADGTCAYERLVDGAWTVDRREVVYQQDFDPERFFVDNHFMPTGAMHRRECVLRCGGFDEAPELRGHEDWELWLRVALAHRIERLPRLTFEYSTRDDASNARTQWSGKFLNSFQVVHARYQPFAALRPGVLDAQREMRARCRAWALAQLDELAPEALERIGAPRLLRQIALGSVVLGDLRDVAANAELALRLAARCPGSAEAWAALSLLCRHAGASGTAFTALDHALALGESAEALAELTLLLAAVGRTAEADATRHHFLSRFPAQAALLAPPAPVPLQAPSFAARPTHASAAPRALCS